MLQSLIQLVVYRRWAAVVCVALVAIYGFHAYRQTAIEAYPDVTNVQVGIIAQSPGLAPEEVERQITLPLERALNGTQGLMSLRSESYFGLSIISLVFDDDANSTDARIQVSQRLSQADLPDDVTQEMAPDNTPLGKIYYYRLNSDRHTLQELRAEQELTVTRVLKQVQGVADVVSLGGFLKEYHVEVDPFKLIAHNLSLEDVVEAIGDSNINVGGGLLRRGEQALIVRGLGLLQTPRDIENIVLPSEGDAPLLVRDVARITLSHMPRQGAVGIDGYDDAVMGIALLQRNENPSRVLDQIHDKVDQLNKTLPRGMRIEVIYDRSELVAATLSTVHHNLLFGACLIIGVLWLFLRSLRGSLIVATVIPVSLLMAFIGLYWLDMPANLISMGAIDFGIIVDGAVVLTEAIIHKARRERPQTRKAMHALIIRAALSVARPTLFAMAIVIAAFIPIFSLEGVEGRIFQPVAMTYAFALIAALILAMTLVPALCALLMKPEAMSSGESDGFEKTAQRYRQHLQYCLVTRRRQFTLVGAGILVLVISLAIGSHLGTEFLPELDEGDGYVLVEMPSSISLEKGQEILRSVRLRLGQFPEVITVVSEQGRPESGDDNETINMAKVLIRLQPQQEWRKDLTKEQLIGDMRATLADIPGVQFNFAQPIRDSVEESTSGARGHVVLKLFGADIEVMRDILAETRTLIAPIEGVVDLDLYRDAPAPQLHLVFNREILAAHGITMNTANQVAGAAIAGLEATTLWEGELAVPVRVRLPLADRMDEARIAEIPVMSPGGAHIPLGDLADIQIKVGNAAIFREANSRYMVLKFNVEGRDIGSVSREAIAAFEENITLPDGYEASWGGEWENQQRAAERLKIVVPLSLAVVFILLVMALHSMRSAGLILLSAPFTMAGGIFALWLTGIDLSISAAIGFIALIGQAALAGLLVLSAVDQRLKDGLAPLPALIDGAAQQLRPVLLVTLLAMLGLLPMAISTGVGSETQRPFATVIVGGMALLPLVSLVLLPALYALFIPARLPSPSSPPSSSLNSEQHPHA